MRLERNDWIQASIQSLIEKGHDSVKVEPLSKQLNVTRGSFYWHFKNRQELLDAILQFWLAEGTSNIIIELEKSNESPFKQLEELLRFTFSLTEQQFAFEHALRRWAATDTTVHKAVNQVDNERIGFMTNLCVALGHSTEQAVELANLIYCSWLGAYMKASCPSDKLRQQMCNFLLEAVQPN